MSTSARPQSVRGLYTPPAEEWVFLPPSVQPPSSSSSAPNPTAPSHLPSSFSTAVEDDENLAIPMMGRPFNLFLSEYLTTAMGMPFEVGKTLLQVEYRPRRRFATDEVEIVEGVREKEEFELQDDQISNPEEADMYFSDRLAQPPAPLAPPPEIVAETDAAGYLPDLHPSWLLNDDPEISRGNGVWGMIRRIRYTSSEGLPGLWKSQLVSTIHSFLSNILQPSIHSFLLILSPNSPVNLDISLSALPNPAIPLSLQVTSHLLTHLLLSPLEVIRTRLIVLPTNHPSTPSSVTIFRKMIDEEGGFSNLYFHQNLLFPSILEHTLRPLLTLSIPLIIERQLKISPDFSPITYSLIDLSLGLSSLLVLLPIETVRKRLQLQSRSRGGKHKDMKSIVKLREKNYVGIVEAIWRILQEETGVRRKRKMTEKDEGGWFAGVRQLYRGFGMAATAHVTVFGLGLVSQLLAGNDGGGWKEI
uniref:Mitochondrial fusion and transport protein Ugo1 n=2 Tax=Kwoniella bestiolae CBS 10118 TaxID=1296100 RepID=A0A1B9G702_9TREE|nr:hypothetical protein I302_04460 [Kwoniella bestiolae CBS 10118]OCF26771.1 hypothetical protein I302_04460 [Kwoniella bestiolae CBS 10118]